MNKKYSQLFLVIFMIAIIGGCSYFVYMTYGKTRKKVGIVEKKIPYTGDIKEGDLKSYWNIKENEERKWYEVAPPSPDEINQQRDIFTGIKRQINE